jgi:Putative transposase of IS4/5 family (DUF4096)
LVVIQALDEPIRLTAAQWAKMEPLCLGKPGDPGRSGKDNRRFVEAVLWIARTGNPWRDSAALVRPLEQRIFDDPDMEYAMIDATIVKVHRHGQGAKGGPKARPSAVRKAA